MTQETEHTEFEKEAKKYGLDSRRAAGAYYDSQTMTAFCLWQTARARGGKGEVDRAFDDGARFAIAMKSAKPVEVESAKHDAFIEWFHNPHRTKLEYPYSGDSALAFHAGYDARTTDTELTRLKRQVERDSISAEEIKGWRLDPKVHDAILNRADPFSVAWHQREKEHQAALSAKAKPIEVGDEHTDDCAINELGDVCDCGVARNIYPMLGTTDTELTRLKRQVEVLSRGLRGLRETTTDNISEVRAENALAAADRIAKGEV